MGSTRYLEMKHVLEYALLWNYELDSNHILSSSRAFALQVHPAVCNTRCEYI